MRKSYIALASILALGGLTGCATNDYKLYAETQVKVAQAYAQAETVKETARYAALAEIAKSGDSASKVAAVMSINFGSASQTQSAVRQSVNPPKTMGDSLLQWTSVLLPSLTQLYSVNANKSIAVTQSNNAAAVATSTNNTMANIAGAGFTGVTSVANNGLTTASTLGTAGLTAATTISGQGTTALTNVGANNAALINSINNTNGQTITNIMNTIPNLQPNITTTTTNNTP